MSNRLYAHYKAYLGAKTERPFTHHGKTKTGTRVQAIDNYTIAIVYHGTAVVTISRDGMVYLNTGGWPTVTTKVRMEEALEPIGKRVRIQGSTLRRGTLPRSPKPWVLEVGTDMYPFISDPAIVEEVFKPYNSYFPVSPFDGKAGGGSRMDDRVTVDGVAFNVLGVL